MTADVLLPRLSDSMEEGTILKWMKSIGDEVALGEELVEIETDKATMVFEADAAGTVLEILAKEGETLPIGQVIARIGPPTGDDGVDSGEAPPPVAAGSTDDRSPAPVLTADGASRGAAAAPVKVKASPLARRMAAELGVDLGSVAGSGPGGRIVKADIEQLAAASSPLHARSRTSSLSIDREAPPAQRPAAGVPAGPILDASGRPETAKGAVAAVELTKLQQTVSRRMAESKATAPHFYLQAEIDMTRCTAARAALKASARDGEPVPSFNDMVVKACALALREFPRANGAYRDGRFELYSRVNVGIAVAGQDALVVPTIFDADRKGLRQLASESRALAQRVRDREITPPELSGGTFTVSNLGMYGMANIVPVINTPNAAILGVGAITETPVVRDGEVTTAQLMGVTLACDHRILYGADGAEFLGRIRSLLAEPLALAL